MVAMTLSIRYEQVMVEPELKAEVPWLRDVQHHLHRFGARLPRIAQSQLSRLVKEYVDKTPINIEARLQQMTPPQSGGIIDPTQLPAELA
jgi:hypothetical protein